MNARVLAIKVMLTVVNDKRSLKEAFGAHLILADAKDKSFIKALCLGTARHYYQLEAIAGQLLSKGFKPKDCDLYLLLLQALYQLNHMRTPSHAVVNAAVAVSKALNKTWAKGLINACLRRYLREKESIDEVVRASDATQYAHPTWLVDKLKQAYPDKYLTILSANNQHPPMSLRVNQRHSSRDDYLRRSHDLGIEAEPCLYSHQGIRLAEGMAVEQLPGFTEGLISVQDEAAQLAAKLLAVDKGQRVLDACAAPGGKTCHLLESDAALTELHALDCEQRRLDKVADNLTRLGLSAHLICGDASTPKQWWDGQLYDQILLDAPCSATGVIRRQPDIKLLRTAEEVANITALQSRLLSALWPLLKPGGRLLYATCSVLPEENSQQIARFIKEHADAKHQVITADWGQPCDFGRQILPGDDNMDGFYYALLQKDVIPSKVLPSS